MLLRGFAIAFGFLALSLGCVGIVSGWPVPANLALLAFGTLVALGILFELDRYKRPTRDRPGPDWVRTEERFIDDETGAVVTVYYKPKTGERLYVKG